MFVKKLIGPVLLIAFGLSVPLLLFELAVWRLPGALLPTVVRQQMREMSARSQEVYGKDPDLGFVIRPGVDVEFSWDESSYRIKTHLNLERAGFRGGTIGGEPWAIALGDSFTFGQGVNQPATWAALLARRVGRDVVNLGVMGYGPQQYTRTLEKFGVALRPKMVLYCLFTNDLRDAAVFDDWINKPPRFSLGNYLSERSVVYNIYYRWRRQQRQGSRYVALDEVEQKLNLRKLKQEIDADSKRIASSWTTVMEQVERARRVSEQAGARFVVAYFPSKEEVYWDLAKRKMAELARYDGRQQQFRDVILSYCRGSSVACLDLTPGLQAQGPVKLYFTVDSHWNEAGHQAVAAELFRLLENERLL